MSVIKLYENAAKFQKRTESNIEINSIIRSIEQNLLSSESCTHTLGAGLAVANNHSLAEIKDKNGNVVYNTSSKYGNNQIQIEAIKLSGVNTSQEIAQIEVGLKRINKLITGPKTIKKRFPIRIKLDAQNKLLKCYSNLENIVDTAKNEFCLASQGSWNEGTQSCQNNNFLLKSGGSLSGTLTAPFLKSSGNIKAGTNLCIGTNCRTTFAEQECPPGQVIFKINTDGTIQCSSIKCSGNTYFRGLKSDGSADCVSFVSKICPSKQYVSKINPDGSKVCSPLPVEPKIECPGESFLKGINADGSPICSGPAPVAKSCSGSSSRTVYEKSSVFSPESCKSIVQTRTCDTTNGTWSAWSPKSSYTSSSCTQLAPPVTDTGRPDAVRPCVDYVWRPNADTICAGTRFTQTSNCGSKRTFFGTMDCSFNVCDEEFGCYEGERQLRYN